LTQYSNGLPYYGGGGDTGIMQICYQRTNSHLWDWTENIEYARTLLTTDMKNGAKSYLDGQVNIGATAYSNPMWRAEAIHRYNAGCCGSSNAYWEWNLNLGIWEVVDMGGVGMYYPGVDQLSGSCT
jgi:hypothetical protein